MVSTGVAAPRMNRREFLQCGILLVSGMSASRIGLSLTVEQEHFLTLSNYNAKSVDFFSVSQRATVAAIAEAIIPRTETPGAVDAGVPRFIELMVSDWLNDKERKQFLDGLRSLMEAAHQIFGKSFTALSPNQQAGMLEELESEASDSEWYQLGNVRRAYISDAPFICQIKELTIWGFFSSEIGGTQVLRYEVMPMEFDGKRKLEPDQSSWFSRFP